MRVQLRRGTAAQWAAVNPVLALGEPGYDSTTPTFKIGDGITAWNALPSAGGGGSGTTVRIAVQAPLTTGSITAANGVLTQIGSDLTVAAVAGNRLHVEINAIASAPSSIPIQFEAATRVSAADVNYWSSANGTSLKPGGVPAWYVETNNFIGPRSGAYYTVQSGDISGGNVTVRLYAFGGGGTRDVVASAVYPMSWALTNMGST